jgi:uncharacterized protein YuzE
MKATYDPEADAMYIYLAPETSYSAARTETYQSLKVELDSSDQVVALCLLESDDLGLANGLRFALHDPGVVYDESSGRLRIAFAPQVTVKRVVDWSANIDLDRHGQVVGVEVLFGGELTGKDKMTLVGLTPLDQ